MSDKLPQGPGNRPEASPDSGMSPKSGSSSGAESVSEAIQPLVDALAAAGKAAETESTGDPKVIAAVKLGWLMKEVTEGWSLKPMPDGTLLTGEQQCQAQAQMMTTLLDTLELTGLESKSKIVTDLIDAIQHGPDKDKAKGFASTLVVAIVASGARFMKAYELGDGLRAMTPGAVLDGGQGEAATAGEPTRSLVEALDALSSELPSHAARGVAGSLAEWSRSDDSAKARLIDAQVALWRSVIVGEKKGTELLEPDDYLGAARQLERRYVSRALRSTWLWVVAGVALLLFVAGIVLLVAANGKPGKVAAGVSGVLAALGLTWKGIGGTVGKLVGKVEAPLWGAELDTAITNAITLAETGAEDENKKKKDDATDPRRAMLSYADRRSRALAGWANSRPRGVWSGARDTCAEAARSSAAVRA
jgi:hypothetical protein